MKHVTRSRDLVTCRKAFLVYHAYRAFRKRSIRMLDINDDFVKRAKYGVGVRRVIKCHATTENRWATPQDHRAAWEQYGGSTNRPSVSSQMTTHHNKWNSLAERTDVHPPNDSRRDGCELTTPHFICKKSTRVRPSNCPHGPIPKLCRIRPQLASQLFIHHSTYRRTNWGNEIAENGN